jgi:hypothetical protein
LGSPMDPNLTPQEASANPPKFKICACNCL